MQAFARLVGARSMRHRLASQISTSANTIGHPLLENVHVHGIRSLSSGPQISVPLFNPDLHDKSDMNRLTSRALRDLDRKSDNAYILKELRKRRYHKRKSIIRREDERKRVYRNFVGHMRHILRHAREGSEVPEDHKIHIIGRKRHGPKK